MATRWRREVGLFFFGALLLGCAGKGGGDEANGTDAGTTTDLGDRPNSDPKGACAVPSDAKPEDTSHPDHVIGDGTPRAAPATRSSPRSRRAAIITFDCGPDPVTITLTKTAKVFNDTGPKLVIDGGNKVTLSGGGKVRILYMNTCDQAQTWTTRSLR